MYCDTVGGPLVCDETELTLAILVTAVGRECRRLCLRRTAEMFDGVSGNMETQWKGLYSRRGGGGDGGRGRGGLEL